MSHLLGNSVCSALGSGLKKKNHPQHLEIICAFKKSPFSFLPKGPSSALWDWDVCTCTLGRELVRHEMHRG